MHEFDSLNITGPTIIYLEIKYTNFNRCILRNKFIILYIFSIEVDTKIREIDERQSM